MDVYQTNIQQLYDAIVSIWTQISKEYLQHLFESIPQRTEIVLKAKGDSTQYWQGVSLIVAGECMSFFWTWYMSNICMIVKCMYDCQMNVWIITNYEFINVFGALPLTVWSRRGRKDGLQTCGDFSGQHTKIFHCRKHGKHSFLTAHTCKHQGWTKPDSNQYSINVVISHGHTACRLPERCHNIHIRDVK